MRLPEDPEVKGTRGDALTVQSQCIPGRHHDTRRRTKEQTQGKGTERELPAREEPQQPVQTVRITGIIRGKPDAPQHVGFETGRALRKKPVPLRPYQFVEDSLVHGLFNAAHGRNTQTFFIAAEFPALATTRSIRTACSGGGRRESFRVPPGGTTRPDPAQRETGPPAG